MERRMDVACVQETRWGGCGCGGIVSPDGVAPTRTADASASIITI